MMFCEQTETEKMWDVIWDVPVTGWVGLGRLRRVMWSDDERGKQGVEGGGKVGERRAVGGAVGEATVDEPPQLGGTAGRRRQPRSRRTQLALPHHVVVGQSP